MMIIQKQPQYIFGTPVGVQIYRVKNELPHYQTDVLELILCLAGSVDITVAHRSFTISQGDIIAVNSGDVHFLSSNAENLLVSYYFDTKHRNFEGKNLDKVDFDIGDNDVPHIQEQINEIRKRLLAILFCRIEENELVAAQRISSLAETITDLMLDHFRLFYMASNDNPHSGEVKERFERIMMFLKENYSRKITAEELSLKEHINPNYLSQYIKKTSSTGFTKILTYIRTHESERILLSQKMDIIEVAYECGFSDPKFYYKSFKELYNRTPHQHRQLYAVLMENEEDIAVQYALDQKTELKHYISKLYTDYII